MLHNLHIPLFFILLLFAFAEAAAFVGFILPGETSLVIGGVLAHAQVWPLWLFIVSAIVAAIIGDSVSYEVGKHLGPRIRDNSFGKFVGERRWNLAQHIFDKYGGWAIFFGRAQALLRALVPAMAGMNKVPYRIFIKWNAAGGIVFGTLVVLLDDTFASNLDKLEKTLRYWVFGFLALVFLFIFLIKQEIERKFSA